MNRRKWSWYSVLMRRWGLNILAGLSLIITLLAALIWLKSIHTGQSLVYTTQSGNCVSVATVPGGLFAYIATDYRDAGALMPPSFTVFPVGWSYLSCRYGVSISKPSQPDPLSPYSSRVESHSIIIVKPPGGLFSHFDATHQEPKVAVCEKRYVFDATQPDDSTKPLSFNAKGACPVYQLDKTIADAVHEERRQEQLKMAQYIATGVSTVPFRVGDGGMNPVFMAKLPSSSGDNNGRLFELTSAPYVTSAAVPGALPRTPNRGAVTLAKLQSPQQPSGPATVASVPMPHAAPQPKEGETPTQQEKPTSIAGLIGELFGRSKSEAAPAPPQTEQVATRSTARSTDLAAKPKQTAPAHTASTPVRTASAGSSPWPTEPSSAPGPAPKPTVEAAPAPKPAPVQQPAKVETPRPEIRTAYTTPPASNNGLLAGAQPVVPTGSFETRWSGMR